MVQIAPGVSADQFVHEGAVEAFVFALSLRVQGPTVDNLHTQAQEPYGEAGVRAGRIATAPGRCIVAKDLFG